MNYLALEGDKIIVKFQYHPRIVNAVREIDGRRFDAGRKRWEVPVENVVECVDLLSACAFTINGDVQRAYTERKRELEAVREIKQSDATYEGKLPLYDFQRTGTALIKRLPAMLLADVPGLGKTLQTCAAFEDLDDQILIFVPASLKFNWRDEIRKWLPNDKVLVVHGTKQERIEQWYHAMKGRAKWIIANYELLIHDYTAIAKAEKVWGAIVCDEADRIANPLAQTTRRLKTLKAQKRLALTGTPVSNSPEDLWSIVDWLYPRYLGSYGQFQKKYCKLHPEYGRVIGYMNLDELKERVESIMLRRLKEQVLKDFPPKTVEYIRFDLSMKERKLYESVKKMIVKEIKEMATMDTRSLALLPVKMLRLKQCTDSPALVGAPLGMECSKMIALKQMLEPIVKSGEKAIVFTQFAEMARLVGIGLMDLETLTITGEVDALERKKIVDEFQSDAKKQVLIMTEAGTYGLNIQAATYVFHYDAPWSVGKLEQREGRAHRVGQDKPVTVYHLIANRTIDEYVLKVLSGKRKIAQGLLGDAPDEQKQLTIDDIEEMLDEEPIEE